MGCGVYWQQIKEIDRAMKTLRKYGIPELGDAFQDMYRIRAKLLSQLGVKLPRTVTQVIRLAGFSPGTFALWHDVESGWMSEARARPGAPPVYKRVSDEVAMAILKREITPELEAQLLAPDEYLGE